eukprot:Nitzschia sp. Nitz4//scaffold295_size27985//18074//19108//NITZ4_008163-RA/size27985-processed-gene-0.45-mRNA-1//1//CDS//3329546251//4451//frame0
MTLEVMSQTAMQDKERLRALSATASATASSVSSNGSVNSQAWAAPKTLSSSLSRNAAEQEILLLSALAARNQQVRALTSSPAGLLTNLGQESISSPLNNASGIVSQLRAAASEQRRENQFLALQQQAQLLGLPSLSPMMTNTSPLSRMLPSILALSMHQDALLGKASLPSSRGPSPVQSPTLKPQQRQLAAVKAKSQRNPIALFMDCDEDSLSEYQCLIRQQMELFEASEEEASSSVQGRNKQIVPGQVGVRCRHCSNVPARRRNKGSMYFPTKLDRIYQAAQNLSAFHLCEHCPHVPPEVRNKILVLRERKSPAGGGKRYWAEGVRCLGVTEDPATCGLRFKA